MDKIQFDQLMAKLNELSNKLNILISPQFKRESKKQDKEITRENIKRLKECGLDYIEIANILGMSSGAVANELTYLKKNNKKIEEKEGEEKNVEP